jgi:DNA polymerase III epsilon subunit family exonuclease
VTPIESIPLVFFDFETTGLDADMDRIIEVGAMKWLDGKVIDQMFTLVSTDIELSDQIVALTGINQEMLKGAPSMAEVLPKFLKFIEGSALVAHNAEFDMGMLRAACSRQGSEIEWPCFCTLKLTRAVLPDLERHNLDSLAKHFDLTFESRHRAEGDIKVMMAMVEQLLKDHSLNYWEDFSSYCVA